MATPRRDSVSRDDVELEEGAWSSSKREKEKLLSPGEGGKSEVESVSHKMAMAFLVVWMIK